MNAQQIIQQAQQTNSLEGWLKAGDALFQMRDYKTALNAYGTAQQLSPKNPQVYLQITTTCVELGMYKKALEACNLLLQLAPNVAKVNILHANVLFHNKQFEQAQQIIDALFQQKLTDEERVLTNRVQLSILSAYGDSKEREVICIKMLEENPDDYSYLRILFIATRTPEKYEHLLEKYSKIADSIKGINNEHDELFFALADGYDLLGNYKKAAKYIKRANAIFRTQRKVDISSNKRILENTPKVLSKEFFTKRDFIKTEKQKMIFVVGMPRSSTSLIEKILASHSKITGAGEQLLMENLSRASARILGGEYPDCLADITEEQIYELTKHYVNEITNKFPDAEYIVDKMPLNFQHLGLMAAMFPEAKFINCVRDLRDVAVSIYSKKFSHGNLWAQDYNDIYFMMDAYKKLMAHWTKVLPTEIYDSNYENLLNDFENETRKLLNYCGLEWEEACLDYHSNKHNVQTASQMQVMQPLFKSSLARWKNYEPFFGKELKKIGELN